ncbi:hypothetical protein AB0E69_04990 [Kribbella sp. NPDC026611]|uniref:hypothetical protein n=1 Tax=Kribbella sp. NPDC026611 TaxID=3154911 RepID=UPI0033C1E91C
MPAKPIPALGLVLGLVLGYVDVVGASYAAYRLAVVRQVRFESAVGHGLQWLLLLLVLALVTGLVMAPRRIGAGAMVGTGLFMAVVGLLVQVLPLRQAADFSKLFQVPGSNFLPYLLLDGSVMFMGAAFLIAGIGRWVSDAKTTRAQLGGGQPALPGQQQWGGYPGQQQQAPYQPQQPPYQPGQPGQQPPPYQPGQQPPR